MSKLFTPEELEKLRRADEDAVRDAQMRKIFSDRDKKVAEQQMQAVEKQRMADRQAIRKARKFRTMAKRELMAFQRKYHALEQFNEVWQAIANIQAAQ